MTLGRRAAVRGVSLPGTNRRSQLAEFGYVVPLCRNNIASEARLLVPLMSHGGPLVR